MPLTFGKVPEAIPLVTITSISRLVPLPVAWLIVRLLELALDPMVLASCTIV